jgi:hypothetical protein
MDWKEYGKENGPGTLLVLIRNLPASNEKKNDTNPGLRADI